MNTNLNKIILNNKASELYLDNKEYFIHETIKLGNINQLKLIGDNTVITSGKLLKQWYEKDGLFLYDAKDEKYSNQLYKNGKLLERPHTKFKSTGAWEMYEDENFIFKNKKIHNDTEYYDGYLSKNIEMLNWVNHDTLELNYDVGWTHCVCPVEKIEKVDDEHIYIKMIQPCFRDCQIKQGMQIKSPNQIYNIKEKLEKGQWYFDKSGKKIIYKPLDNEKINELEFIMPLLENLITIENSSNIIFENITFKYSSWLKPSIEGLPDGQANLCKNFDIPKNSITQFRKPEAAIKISNSSDIQFSKCTFTSLGCCAIDIDEGAKYININKCTFDNIAANGIMVSSFNFKCGHEKNEQLITEHINIINNEFYNIGSEYRSGVAIIAGYIRNSNICHNEVHDVAYTGISLGWGWGFDDPNYKYSDIKHNRLDFGTFDTYPIMENNHIDYNHIYNVMTKMHDGAGIYTLSMNQNSSIIGNYVHDNGNFKGIPYEELFIFRIKTDIDTPKCKEIIERESFPGGIYLDEGSGGFIVKNNVVCNVACPFYYHYTGIVGVFETNTYKDNHISDDKSNKALDIIKYAGKET